MSGLTVNRILLVVLLGAISVHQHVAFYRSPGVEAYHARIREAMGAIPQRIGAWVGQDVPVRAQALTVLHPNAMISRHYVNVETGATADLLLVHTADAHSIVGHYPARCYPAEGWTLAQATARDWVVGELRLTGTEYEFTMDNELETGQGEQDIIVANCLFRPRGLVLRDMDRLSSSIVGAEGQSTGAAEMQVIFEASVPQKQRDATIADLVEGYRPAIEAILSWPGESGAGATEQSPGDKNQ
jgi:hypothetical protein